MNGSPSELASLLGRLPTTIATIFRQEPSAVKRAEQLAELLRQGQPSAVLAACLLPECGTDDLAFQPQPDALSPAQENELRQLLTSGTPSRTTGLGLRLLISPLDEREPAQGFLALGLPENAPAAAVERAEILLAVAASSVVLCWHMEALRRERVELSRFALVGQAFAGLAHELNNALNSMMLQTSVVQLKVDAQTRTDLMAIRQHGAHAAGLVRSLQHIVQERREQFYPVSLSHALREVLELPELGRRVTFDPDAEDKSILGTRSAVKQLLRLLLEALCAGTKAAIQATVEPTDNGVTLRLSSAEATPETQDEAPAAETLFWQDLDEVSRQAGQSLLRQLGGTLQREQTSEGTAVWLVRWEQSS